MAEQPEEFEPSMLAFARALAKDSDRVCAIVTASLLASDLEKLLRSAFRRDVPSTAIDRLFATYAPLSSFAARIDLAYAMGLITHGMRSRITLIRRLRNTMAHTWENPDFDSGATGNLVDAIIGPESRHIEDADKLMPHGAPVKNMRQMYRRLLLGLQAAKMRGAMDAVTHALETGMDPRVITKHFETKEESGDFP